tara:strand:+ start:10020 stop:10436 length:417 start_codon:yes stop_codon:yes gene_type:complete
MKILILYGPNMNLFGLWSSKNNKTDTLNKINRHIRNYTNKKNIQLKIIQTNNESKAISYIQNNRKKFNAIIIVPGPWQYSAYALADLLDLIEIPFITITYKIKDYIKLLNGFENLIDDNLNRAFEHAINLIEEKLKDK